MRDFSLEIFFRTARSGGKGGQNVNKVETMAEAWWHVASSRLFTPEEKELIAAKLRNNITKEGYLLFKSSETRSQLENKEIAAQKMLEAVNKAIIVPKKRKATKPSKASVEKRLEEKRREAAKKQWRRGDY